MKNSQNFSFYSKISYRVVSKVKCIKTYRILAYVYERHKECYLRVYKIHKKSIFLRKSVRHAIRDS
jgi:hypothetical protein